MYNVLYNLGSYELNTSVPNEELLEAERTRVRIEYEKEMEEIREKYKSEQQSKAKIQSEVGFNLKGQ